MRFVADFLDTMGIMDKEDFLNGYATTFFSTIYVPFVVGEGANLWDQMSLCAHECQHVFQSRNDGPLTFATRYLTSATSRAHYEADAYRVGMELAHWRYGSVADTEPTRLAEKLRAYNCGDSEVAFVREYLEASLETVREGGVISLASQRALVWLEQHGQELRV